MWIRLKPSWPKIVQNELHCNMSLWATFTTVSRLSAVTARTLKYRMVLHIAYTIRAQLLSAASRQMPDDVKLKIKASLQFVRAVVLEPSPQTQSPTVCCKDSFRQPVHYTKRFKRCVFEHQRHIRLRTCHLKYRPAMNPGPTKTWPMQSRLRGPPV